MLNGFRVFIVTYLQIVSEPGARPQAPPPKAEERAWYILCAHASIIHRINIKIGSAMKKSRSTKLTEYPTSTQGTSILSLKQPNELRQLFGFQGKNLNDNFR